MNLYNFLDSIYVGTNVELTKEYSAAKHAETLASQDLIEAQRKVLKWFMWFKIIGHYFMVKIGIFPALKDAREIQEDYKVEAIAEQKRIAIDRQAAIDEEHAKQKAKLEIVPDVTNPVG